MVKDIDKLDIAELVNIPTSLNNLEIKVDDLDAGKFKTAPISSKKLSDVVKNELVKNTKFNTLKTKLNNLGKNTLEATNLIHIYQCKTDKQTLEKKLRCW